MPRSVLILLVAAVIGLCVLTWYQLFRDVPVAPPELDGNSAQVDATDPRSAENDPPTLPVVVPRDVPLSVRALELLQALTRAMLGDPIVVDEADLAWLRDTEEGVAELRRLLETSEDENLKAVVLLTLGRSTVEGTFETLKEAAGGQYGERLRTAGIVGMLYGEPETIHALRQIFVDTRDEGVAAASLQVLSHLGSDLALAVIDGLLGSTQESGKRDTLYQILGGTRFSLETDEPEVMVRFRADLEGLAPPEPEPDPEQSKVIDSIVDQVIREEDPMLRESVMVILARMPGVKAEQAFLDRFKAADNEHQRGLLGLIHPDMSRGKINAFLRMAPEMEDQRQREILSMQAAQWRDPSIMGELRIWRDREEDESIRLRLIETIRRFEGR